MYKMSHNIIIVFLILVFYNSVVINAESETEKRTFRIELFERGVTTVPFEEANGTVWQRAAHSYRIPCLVEVDGVMVAMGDARYVRSNDNSFIETVAKFSVDGGETWETQIAIKNSRVSNVSRVMDPTVIVKGNKIFVLVGSYNISTTYWNWHPDGSDWEPLLVVGEVTKTTVDGNPKATITWSSPRSLKSVLPAEVAGGPSKQFLGGVGTAIVSSNGTLIFPVQARSTNGKIVAMIMYSVDDGETWSFAKGESNRGCSEPSLVEWEDKLIMNTRFDVGFRLVYESTDMGATWTEAVHTLSRVWGNSPTRVGPGSQSSFITVTIEGKRVMLFTNPLNFKGRWQRDRLHLWVTDNQRIFDVGQISIGDENAAYSSLLYTNDKLYCLHEINHKEVYSLVFAHLIDELELIKSVIRNWTAQDAYFSQTCTPVETESSPTGGNCGAPFPVQGLIGYLFNETEDEETWNNKYRGVDALVSGGEMVSNGMQLKNVSSGVLWPVRLQGQNQLYRFANYEFTVLATVTIDELPTNESSPLLGACIDRYGKLRVLDLSYGNDNTWIPGYGTVNGTSNVKWELNKEYHVAISLYDEKGSIYVNGEALEGSGERITYPQSKTRELALFYIGGYGSTTVVTDSRVTISNVFLYNRRLEPSEIKTMYLSKNRIGVTEEELNSSKESNPSTDGKDRKEEELNSASVGNPLTDDMKSHGTNTSSDDKDKGEEELNSSKESNPSTDDTKSNGSNTSSDDKDTGNSFSDSGESRNKTDNETVAIFQDGSVIIGASILMLFFFCIFI